VAWGVLADGAGAVAPGSVPSRPGAEAVPPSVPSGVSPPRGAAGPRTGPAGALDPGSGPAGDDPERSRASCDSSSVSSRVRRPPQEAAEGSEGTMLQRLHRSGGAARAPRHLLDRLVEDEAAGEDITVVFDQAAHGLAQLGGPGQGVDHVRSNRTFQPPPLHGRRRLPPGGVGPRDPSRRRLRPHDRKSSAGGRRIRARPRLRPVGLSDRGQPAVARALSSA
jgi:hypothetical protein